MAQVVKSAINTEGPQRDGRRWVHLRHELDDGTTEESSTLIDGNITPLGLKNAQVKEIEERPLPEMPDPFLVKLDNARASFLAGDRAGAEAALAVKTEVRR